MTIQSKKLDRDSVAVSLSGRLDTLAAHKLEQKVKQVADGKTDIILDFKGLDYISSSGLHVLLQLYKTMSIKKRKLVIKNMNEPVREVFEMTGFISLIPSEE